MGKVLVTGGAGFIGSHMTRRLLEDGEEVIVLDNLSTGRRNYLPNHGQLSFVVGDIRDPFSINQIFQHHTDIDQIVHLAAQSNISVSLANPAEDAEINILGTIHLLEEARKHGVKVFVYASSAAIYGRQDTLPVSEGAWKEPSSPYGVSKLASEHYVESIGKLYGMNTGCFRFSNVYGPRQSAAPESGVISIFIHKLVNRETPIVFGDGEQTRDFIYVGDLVDGVSQFLDQAKEAVHPLHQTYNVSTDTETSINDLLSVIDEVLGTASVPEYRKARAGDIPFSRLKNEKLSSAISWTPSTPLTDGIRETIRYHETKNA